MPVSATTIRVPSGDHAVEAGASSCPSAEPWDPNLPANMPSASNTWTRWLNVSATAIMPAGGAAGGSGGANATARGDSNCPLSMPRDPNSPAGVPLPALNRLTRLLPVSDTAIHLPDGEYTADLGPSSCPGPDPPVPNLSTNAP